MPNIAPSTTDDARDKQLRGRIQTIKKAEFIWPIKYKNTLPDIPFDPKHLRYPFDKTRFVKYTQTSLEKQFNHDLLTESDLGIKIDLVDADLNENDEEKRAVLDEDDDKLLEDEIIVPKHTKRSQCHNRQIAWLKKTEYISTDFNRYGAKNEIDKAEVKVGYGIRKNLKEDIVFLDRDEQIKAIDRTFVAAKKPITTHPTKKNLTPVEVLPVYPDFDNWKVPFAQVMFDADPAPSTRDQEMSRALIRGIMDESGEQFVAYFLPTKVTLDKLKMDSLDHKDEITEEEFEFHISREYCWDVMNKATKGYEENFFFVWKDDMVCYNELETRVKLTKRRNKSKKPTNSKLFVKHRRLNEQEVTVEKNRLTQLERPIEEEEEEEIVEDAHENNNTQQDQDDDNEDQDRRKDDKKNDDEDDDDDDDDDDDEDDHKQQVSREDNNADDNRKKTTKNSKSSNKKKKNKDDDSDDEDDDDDDDDSDEDRKRHKKDDAQRRNARKNSSDKEESDSSSSSSSSRSSRSSSESSEDNHSNNKKPKVAEIFGPDSDSDSD